MNIIPIDQTCLHNNIFDLKIPVTSLLEKFDARLISEDEKKYLKPILQEWKRIAEEKAQVYDGYKSKKKAESHIKNYINPFINSSKIITELEELLDNKDNYYFGAYDKETYQLQALAVIGYYQLGATEVLIKYLTTNPTNIRTRCNKKRISGAASRVIYEIANWEKDPGYKIDKIHLISMDGSRSFYQHINFKPINPPRREQWELPLSINARDEWIENHLDYLENPVLDYTDLTEESSAEG